MLIATAGVSRRQLQLIFAWSQATVADELRRRARATSLMFFDFVEALARVAELLELPDTRQWNEYFHEKPNACLSARCGPGGGVDAWNRIVLNR